MDLKLDSKFFKENFRIVSLGARDDVCTDADELSGAIPKLWSRELEVEFREQLWWMKFIGTGLNVGVVEKKELITQPGDTIYINKLAQLTNDGDLGDTHLLEGDEEKLNLTRVAFVPVRKGNAVCWTYISGKRVTFNLRNEVKSLLADWSANKVDTMLMAAAILTPNIIYSGVASSKDTITGTDTFSAHDLKRLSTLLEANKAKAVAGAEGNYICLVHPYQYYDLLNDADWVAAARYEGSKKIFKGYVGTYMNMDVLRTNNVPSQLNAASPGTRVYKAIAFGARAMGLAWGLPWTWREKISSYGEMVGIGTDSWIQAALLNSDYIWMCMSGATDPNVS